MVIENIKYKKVYKCPVDIKSKFDSKVPRNLILLLNFQTPDESFDGTLLTVSKKNKKV